MKCEYVRRHQYVEKRIAPVRPWMNHIKGDRMNDKGMDACPFAAEPTISPNKLSHP